MEEQYKYFAFISFQSADAHEALRMQRALETYRLPYSVSRRQGLPRQIGRCFCYLTDINLREELMQELQQQLAESKYLIVVCSPESAKSTFVNGGIERFVELGRRDRIIPLIVRGVPYSGDPATECYPEALRRHFPKSSNPFEDHQILGVNIHEEGTANHRAAHRRAVVMVIARMLGLDVNELVRRDLQRRRQLRIAVTGLLLVVAAMLLGVWHVNQPFRQDFRIAEAVDCPHLPTMQTPQISLYLADEVRTQTALSFINIPARERGKRVRVTAETEDFLPLDTMVVLGEEVSLVLHRRETVYGHVEATLVGVDATGHRLQVAGQDVRPDAAGHFVVDVPLPKQQTAYTVTLDGTTLGMLFMPCGPNDILMVEQ